MRKILVIFILSFTFLQTGYSQIVIPVPVGLIGNHLMPEHGFLPGKQFPIFSTIGEYDFQGLKIRIELYDDRESLKLHRINCSEVDINNTSEFASPQTIYKVKQYVESLFHQSGIVIDSTSNDTLELRLEAIDSRLIGFGYIKAHGLCQLRVRYKSFNKVYCTDIVDGDKHSPLGANAVVTRQTATRYMTSASIRETIEQFLIDLKE